MANYLSELPSLVDVKTEKARRHLSDYIRQAWPIVEPATKYLHNWHIDAISEHLEACLRREILKLVINMPPRHAKSLNVAVFFPSWAWIDHPEIRWLFSSYALQLSVRDSLKCRRIINSSWYQSRWGDRFTLTGDQNIKSRFENDKTGYRLATSVESAVTGEGGDIIVVDDPHNVKEAASDTVRQATIDWWDQTMSTRLNDPKLGVKIIVMQRVHEDDLSGHVLKQEGWDHLCLPAEYDPKAQQRITSIGWKDPRTQEGELLWPERMGPKQIAEAKVALGSYGYAGQYQQAPSPLEGGIIKRSWWKFYQNTPPHFDEIILSWDMNFKDVETSKTGDPDYVVGQAWGRVGADKYLLAQKRGQYSFVETIDQFERLCTYFPNAWAKYVEDKANGPAVINTLKHKISGIIAVTPEGSKEARVHAVSPQIEAGNVYLPDPGIRGCEWVQGFIEEFAMFPNASKDDQVDAATQALLKLSGISLGSMETGYAAI